MPQPVTESETKLLERAVEKLVLYAEQVGVAPEEMISLSKPGDSATLRFFFAKIGANEFNRDFSTTIALFLVCRRFGPPRPVSLWFLSTGL